MFTSNYVATNPHHELQSSFAAISNASAFLPKVGAYNDGVLMVVDATSSASLLSSWLWLLGDECRALMTTGFGDVFFLHPAKGVCFLEVQRASIEFVDAEIDWFLGEFLAIPEVVDKVLKKQRFDQLVRIKRRLNYHEVFVLEPWLMLGGEDKDANYGIGECSVYVDLVGQTYGQTR